jgi:hypothetical protein
MMPVAIAMTVATPSIALAAPSAWPCMLFVELTANVWPFAPITRPSA